jgi:hypothetical protein
VSYRRQAVCLFGTLLIVASLGRAASPAPQPVPKLAGEQPYKLTVVLDIAKSRVLTDVFRQQVERELQEGLQAALGELAIVEVRSDHPKLADVRARGLGPALNDWKERSDTKTHFLLIDLVNSQYEIQSRQYDGPTAMPGPVVHTDSTADRAFVARVATLLVERDFGFTATFGSWPKVDDPRNQPQPVQLNLQGAGLGVPLSRWVKKDDVFAVVETYSDGRNPEIVPWALLQIKEAPQEAAPDTACTGLLFWRYKPGEERRGHAGYRCVKLGAIRGPVRLRLLQEKDGKVTGPLLQANLEIRRTGFRGEDNGKITDSPNSVTGIYTTAGKPNIEPFDRVVFITIRQRDQDKAYLPLAIMDEQTVSVSVSTATEEVDALTQRFERWQRQVDDAWLVHVAIFQDIRELGQKAGVQREKVLDRARSGLARTTDDLNRLTRDREEMPREISRRPDLKRLEAVLQELEAGKKQLAEFVEKQEKISAELDKPERKLAEAQKVDAGLAEEKAEYGQAIELYKKAWEELKDPKLKERIDQLEAQWTPRDDAHRNARHFIYDTWPTLDTAGLEREMDSARKALAEFKRVGDRVGAKKVVLATKTHTSRLQQELAKLGGQKFDVDEKDRERLGKVSEGLTQMMRDALEIMNTKSN